MNETYYLKISGKVNVPTKLEIGHNYKLVMDCSVTKEERSDNDDGTFSVVSKIEPITAEITKDNGEVVKAKDTRKNSQKIRNLLHFKWQSMVDAIDFELLYDKVTGYILRNMDTIIKESK